MAEQEKKSTIEGLIMSWRNTPLKISGLENQLLKLRQEREELKHKTTEARLTLDGAKSLEKHLQ